MAVYTPRKSRRSDMMARNSFMPGESAGIPNEIWEQINPIVGKMLNYSNPSVGNNEPTRMPAPVQPRVNLPIPQAGESPNIFPETNTPELTQPPYSRERFADAPIPSDYSQTRERYLGDDTERRIQNREAFMTDPALKNAPENKVPFWKRILYGAAVGLQDAYQAYQQNPEMSGWQAIGQIGAGALGGGLNQKAVADMINQQEIGQLQQQQSRVYQRRKQQAELQKAAEESINRGLDAKVKQSQAVYNQARAQQALEGGKNPNLQVKTVGKYVVNYNPKTGETSPLLIDGKPVEATKTYKVNIDGNEVELTGSQYANYEATRSQRQESQDERTYTKNYNTERDWQQDVDKVKTRNAALKDKYNESIRSWEKDKTKIYADKETVDRRVSDAQDELAAQQEALNDIDTSNPQGATLYRQVLGKIHALEKEISNGYAKSQALKTQLDDMAKSPPKEPTYESEPSRPQQFAPRQKFGENDLRQRMKGKYTPEQIEQAVKQARAQGLLK